MKAHIKRWLRPWIPPALMNLRRKAPPRWITFGGDYQSWAAALAASEGYDSALILEKTSDAVAKVERGEAAYERDSVLFDAVEVSWPVLAGLLWSAGRDGQRLRVLDFGGSLGTTFRQNRQFLGHLAEVRWGVVEQPHYVARGQERFTTDTLRFFASIGECVAALRPNVALLGSVLHYLSDPVAVLDEIAASPVATLIIDQTPFTALAEDRITVQTVPPTIYAASYPARIFSEPRFRSHIARAWKVMAAFDTSGVTVVTETGINFTFKGFILTRA